MVDKDPVKRITILVTPGFLQKLGTASLSGWLMAHNCNALPEEVELCFQVSSQEFKEKNGPRVDLLYEYNVSCLIENILVLQRQHGIKFTTGEFVADDEIPA